jgi:alpha-N-arabinofuranosidase
MVLTPTYHVFRMYVPFQDATFVPVAYDAGAYTHGEISLPRVDAIAARDAAGKLWLAITHLDPSRSVEVEVAVAGVSARSAAGETLTAATVDSVNSFAAPRTVAPRPVSAEARGGRVALRLEPKSVTVVSVEH